MGQDDLLAIPEDSIAVGLPGGPEPTTGVRLILILLRETFNRCLHRYSFSLFALPTLAERKDVA